MKNLRILVGAFVATAALAATPAFAGDGGSTDPEPVTANVYFEEGDCDGLPTIDVESQEGVIYTLNGEVLPITEFTVPYGTSGVVIATAEEGYVIVGQSEFPFDFTFDEETCGGDTTGGDTGGDTTGGDTTGGDTTGGDTGGDTGGTTGGGTTGGGTTGGGTTGTGGVSPGGGGATGGATGGTTGGGPGTQTGGELPFTGLPVWIPLLAAAALLSGGALLLRRKRDEQS
jgi:hypothetical protein